MKRMLWIAVGAMLGIAATAIINNSGGQTASAESAPFDAAGPTTALVTFCSCVGDANGDNVVNFGDITAVLGNWLTVCDVDADGDGFDNTVDCNDFDNQIFPGALEVCDNVDNNCDGLIDEGFDLYADPNNCGACGIVCDQLPNSTVFCVVPSCSFTCIPGFIDFDGDPLNGCESPDADNDGWPPPLDCDDADPTVNPAAVEICGDSIDNNCNGQVDENCPP